MRYKVGWYFLGSDWLGKEAIFRITDIDSDGIHRGGIWMEDGCIYKEIGASGSFSEDSDFASRIKWVKEILDDDVEDMVMVHLI